jgi:hypothetical protein
VPATAAPELDTGRGVAPAELATRCRMHAGGLTAALVVEWLLDENYATLVDGRLVRPQQLRSLF